ncbi:MAG TPA: zinc ribbon domain-containing protein [Candidatus Thermoplasmatota archaeon]|nr:zinc ribbon domain-containing protein [Candidatus Thermoplasmatota archaeon]
MRRGLRFALWAWFFTGLLGVSYVGVVWASSAALTDEAAGSMYRPTEPASLRPGESVLVMPLAKAAPALDPSSPSFHGGRGTVVVWGDGDAPGGLLGLESARHVGRLLARAERAGDGWTVRAGESVLAANATNVTLEVPAYAPSGEATGTMNVTADLTPLGNASGWVVKADLWRVAEAVPDDAVRGEIVGSLPTGALHAGLVIAVIGTLLPLALIVYHHEPRGTSVSITLPSRPGEGGPGTAGVPCPECRRPVSPGSTFCLACGAMLPAPPPR